MKWLIRVALGFTVFLACGAIYQTVAGIRDRRLNPPPGQLVDIGGYKMHLDCTGQGSSAVILESGLADTWLAKGTGRRTQIG